ncbi:MAG TPA: glycosyltransferase [Candidatus Binatia bacterium]|jgi:glycosyltransferase involved in cell wall biosynthesis|nr:glycosyltransferase [Candidatus Binatia bacterium]
MNGLPRLKLLLLMPQLPYPPDQGTSLRNFYIVRGLAESHEVHLLSFAGPRERSTAKPLEQFCAQITTVPLPERTFGQRLWRLLVDPRPDMAHRLESALFGAALRKLLKKQRFDIVQIEGIELAAMLTTIRDLQPECRIVFDDHNAEAELQRRMAVTDLGRPSGWVGAAYSFVQWRRLRRFEGWVCRQSDGVSVVSEADRQHLRDLAPELDPMVIPNCIDLEEYRDISSRYADEQRYDLLFVGKMDYRPNVDAILWFAGEIWPLIRTSAPHLRFAVLGKQPHPRLRSLTNVPGICVIGAVPDINPFLANARVYVLPFRIGSGTRLKLIEAFASGIPTVSTRIGAEGYPLEDRQHILLADSPNLFAEAVLLLLRDDRLRERLQANALAFAQQYDWRRIVPRFDDLYRRVLGA